MQTITTPPPPSIVDDPAVEDYLVRFSYDVPVLLEKIMDDHEEKVKALGPSFDLYFKCSDENCSGHRLGELQHEILQEIVTKTFFASSGFFTALPRDYDLKKLFKKKPKETFIDAAVGMGKTPFSAREKIRFLADQFGGTNSDMLFSFFWVREDSEPHGKILNVASLEDLLLQVGEISTRYLILLRHSSHLLDSDLIDFFRSLISQ